MSKIKGTIASLGDFLFKKEVVISTEYNAKKYTILKFLKDRILFIPKYQREIRWQRETLFSLMNDIYHGGKFLGNIILSDCNDGNYEIIDGQQRIVSLCMLLNYIKQKFPSVIDDLDELVELRLNCFNKFAEFQSNFYTFEGMNEQTQKEIVESDKLRQRDVLTELYTSIEESSILNTDASARDFVENLCKCDINVIVAGLDQDKMSAQYYIDVNLKGLKLDTEDIFKGYLFSLDSSETIREAWVELKQAWYSFIEACNEKKFKANIYPLMKVLEHYIYCCVLSLPEYSNVQINEKFTLEKECVVNGTKYYQGEHVIRVINKNALMKDVVKGTKEYIDFMRDLVSVDGVTCTIKKYITKLNNGDERFIISNLIKKVLLDGKLIVPKVLLLKYFLQIKNISHSKSDEHDIYSCYFYIVFFMLFGDKSNDVEQIKSIARSNDFHVKLAEGIEVLLNEKNLVDSKYIAITRWNSDFDNEDLQFKFRSLATLYNFFSYDKNTKMVKLKVPVEQVKRFIMDNEAFTVEHFIVNKSCSVKHLDNRESVPVPEPIKGYANYIFNFIFIPKTLNNEELKDLPLHKKITILSKPENINKISCEYSKFIINLVKECFTEGPTIESLSKKELIDLEKYWLVTFKHEYYGYTTRLLTELIAKIKL